MARKKIINIVTLGCSKNLVDSEYLMSQLKNSGFEIVHNSDDINAKIAIINTCGFIGDAKEESIDTILKFVKAKQAGYIEHLFVMGCLSERYKKDLEQEIPEVDSYFGVNDMQDIIAAAGGNYKAELIGERQLTTPSHYAYLKISEGCNWGCGYCAIPLIRGKHKSVPMERILKEAERLAAKGVKELLVIAQDTTYYGLDLYGKRKLGELLRALCKIKGIEWIRLHYAYPAQFPQDVIEAIREEPKICKYIDIPFQHCSDNMLSSMRRGLNKKETQALIDKLKKEIPSIAIRTTFIAGYPGESEADFEELKEFVAHNKFDRLGVFAYSEEEGTYSATKLTDDVPSEEKERRVDVLMKLQAEVSKNNNDKYIGKCQKVIIDRREGDYYVGRTEYDSPEVDQEVLIRSDRKLDIGNFYNAEIYAADIYDIYGQVV